MPRVGASAEEILRVCRERLSGFKVPKAVSLAEELPLTAYGKIDKKRLRAPFWDGQARAIH